jgi:ABC-2 type transport system permease protein
MNSTSLRRIRVVIVKEWLDAFKNRYILLIGILLPLLLTAIPLILLEVARTMSAQQLGVGNSLPAFLRQNPALQNLQPNEIFQAALANQFMLLFLILALPLPVAMAAYSIVGEKRDRSLEPLLATPISIPELLLAKGLAALIPGVLSTWLCFVIYLAAARALVLSDAVYSAIFNPTWLLAMFVVMPLLTLLSVCIGLMVSSRSNDPRAAEQLNTFVILPILVLFFSQLLGISVVNTLTILILALLIVIVDIIFLRLAVRLFQRETILTRWR